MEDTKQYYGLDELDRLVEPYVDFDDGYFIEIGANDGLRFNNTLYFERHRGWRGLLIEPSLHKFLKCRASRSPKNSYFCGACVSFDWQLPYVELVYSDFWTAPYGLETDLPTTADEHARMGAIYLRDGEEPVKFLAPARTITRVLDDADAPGFIDLFSLDVEGAEIEVLKGVDFGRYEFRVILVECRNLEKLASFLREKGYVCVDKLSEHDYVFKREEIPK